METLVQHEAKKKHGLGVDPASNDQRLQNLHDFAFCWVGEAQRLFLARAKPLKQALPLPTKSMIFVGYQ